MAERPAALPLYSFQSTNGQPSFHPEQPKPRFPSITGRPQRGQSPSRVSSIVAVVRRADDPAGVPDDLRHEPVRVQPAALDLAQLGLPLARQLRALEPPVPDQGDQVAARVGRDDRLLLADDVAPRRAASR